MTFYAEVNRRLEDIVKSLEDVRWDLSQVKLRLDGLEKREPRITDFKPSKKASKTWR